MNHPKQAIKSYASLGVNVAAALRTLEHVSISFNCWQGDDVKGFEQAGSSLAASGLQVTGNYPGRARTVDELQQDLKKVFSLVPGKHRLNLHAIYGEFKGAKVDRDAIGPEHFEGWMAWARREKIKLDFNATCFAHPYAASGLTLAHPEKSVREFWIKHVRQCRKIAAVMGRKQGSPCIHNLWIPDGAKDTPIDKIAYRKRLLASLETIYSNKHNINEINDSVESKLFGIGSEAFVVGSHEFYLPFALKNNLMLCLDMGHFHPTESIADKVSSLLLFFPEILLHISRGIRWDSDHGPLHNEELQTLADELVRNRLLSRAHLALDFFDAGINRVGAWVMAGRAVQKALLVSLLQPVNLLKKYEAQGNRFACQAVLEESKTLPWGEIWDAYCRNAGVLTEREIRAEIAQYEKIEFAKR